MRAAPAQGRSGLALGRVGPRLCWALSLVMLALFLGGGTPIGLRLLSSFFGGGAVPSLLWSGAAFSTHFCVPSSPL